MEVPSEDDQLPQAGTESQGAVQDPTKLSLRFPDEAAGQGEVVPGGSKKLGALPNSLEGEEEEGCQDRVLSGSVGQIASAMRALGVDLLQEIETDDSRGNTILSPLSISLALAHLALGNTAQETTLLGGGRLMTPPGSGKYPSGKSILQRGNWPPPLLLLLLLLSLFPAVPFVLLNSSCHQCRDGPAGPKGGE